MYILILFYLYKGGVATAEFNTLERCNKAIASIKEVQKYNKAVCVKK